MSLLDPVRQVAERLDRHSRRERVLLALAVAVVVVLAWDIGLRAPLAQREAAARERIATARSDLERLQASVQRLTEQAADDGRGRDAVAALELRVGRVDAQLAERTRRIIAPADMVEVLRDVLADDEKLRLIALHNAGVEPIAIEGASAAELPTIYRHRVEITIEGGYFALLNYLERLEGLRWRFQWNGLQIETTNYPTARATLALSTLSLAEDWIGV